LCCAKGRNNERLLLLLFLLFNDFLRAHEKIYWSFLGLQNILQFAVVVVERREMHGQVVANNDGAVIERTDGVVVRSFVRSSSSS